MLDRVRSWMGAAERVVVLTGAGISAESGVPVFRGANGLWRQVRPEQLATPDAFAHNLALVWQWYGWRRERVAAAEPDAGHRTIACWQRERPNATLLTQNVDHAAPPRNRLRCACRAWPRRAVVWCGAALDPPTLDAAVVAVEEADVVLVVGTSAVGYPVAALPQLARRRQARIVEVDVDETPLSSSAAAVLRGPAGEVLPALQESR